ncbi:MAG: hypothetical protein ACLQBX_15965 [Candidatus Limnocylindrales bacterium]
MNLQVVERVDTEKIGILRKIRTAEERCAAAQTALGAARHDRDELVVIARDLHQCSYSEIARALGHGKSRVHGILTDSEAFRPPAGGA